MAAGLMFCFGSQAMAEPVAADCGKPAFQKVVAEAGAALNDLNLRNAELFQERMQRLKAAKAWTDGDFAAQAKAIVADEKTAAIDAEGKALMARAGALNAEGASGERLCALLNEVRSLMGEIVGNARSRWDYMLGKVDAALGVSTAAKGGK